MSCNSSTCSCQVENKKHSKLSKFVEELEKGKYLFLSLIFVLLSFLLPLFIEGGFHEHEFGESQNVFALPWYHYLAIVPIFISGLPIIYAGLRNLFVHRRIKSSLLITIALFASIGIGQLLVAAEIAFLMALGEYLEAKTVANAKQGINRLMQILPSEVSVLVGEEEQKIDIDKVKVGDLIRVRPGELIALDAQVVEGESSVQQSNITGESLPVDVTKGSMLYSGTQNLQGSLLLRVCNTSDNSSMQRMIELMNMAEHSKSKIENTADKWAAWLVPIALVVAIIVYLFTQDIVRMVSVLVVFCPCAFALATPTCVVAAIGQASGKGVLIKNKTVLEALAKCQTMAFDKTGTLTQGKLLVSDILPLAEIDEAEILKIAHSLEYYSEHPLAQAIVAHAKGQERYAVEDFSASAGRGVQGRIEGGLYRIERTQHPSALAFAEQGMATMLLESEGRELAIIALQDSLKANAKDCINKLHSLGMESVLLSGDSKAAVAHMAESLNIKEYLAGLLPEEKVEAIQNLKFQGKTVAMVGDGMNDAPALKIADASIAMADSGSGVSVEAADIVLLGGDIGKLPYVKKLAEKTIWNVKFNLTLAMGINIVAVILSAAGLLNPLFGALVHNAGSVLVTLNAALLYRRKIRV